MRFTNASMVAISLVAPAMVRPVSAKPMPGNCHPVNGVFLRALAKVEYSGKGKAPPGDGGRAVGCLQIHDIYVKEANHILGFPAFNSKDRNDREASFEMARIVLTHHGRRYARMGYSIGPAELASIHRNQYGWSPKNLMTKLEESRTKRLYTYLYELSKKR